MIKTEVGIIGGGLAGCSAALELADAGKKVDLFVKKDLIENCNSYLTAGGLTAVSPESIKHEDSYELHVKDTLEAGKFLNNKKIVEYCSRHFFPDVIKWLESKGIEFDKTNGKYNLHIEGGHSASRIFHVKDTTGRAIMNVLGNLVKNHKNIKVHENHVAIDLITKNKFFKQEEKDSCLGFYVYDITNNQVKTVSCQATFICTGGLGKVFMYTSNQDIASGDGFALAYRAGLSISNIEFVQFHQTVFYDIQATSEFERRFLLTEALRGAGAFLKLEKNSREDFVLKYDSQGSKATRDIVTRAEDIEMRKLGLKHLWLDCTKIPQDVLKNDFKNSYEFCLSKGIKLEKEPAPVVYAEHYSNGGILVGENSETELPGCYAIGEVSYTGLHGATRLASNSAPECILFGRLAAKHFLLNPRKDKLKIPLWKDLGEEVKDKETIQYYWETIRRTLTNLCGIARNEERLTAAKEVLLALKKDINDFYWHYHVTKDFLEVRNIADTALLIIESALFRKESRACHFREDFPEENKKYLGITLVQKDKSPKIENA